MSKIAKVKEDKYLRVEFISQNEFEQSTIYRLMIADPDHFPTPVALDLLFHHGVLEDMEDAGVYEELEKYTGPRKLNTEEGVDKIYSRHDEKTVHSRFQGQSRAGTSQRREDLRANRRRT